VPPRSLLGMDGDFTPGITYSVVLAGLFGTASYMARQAGRTTSPAKAAAARTKVRRAVARVNQPTPDTLLPRRISAGPSAARCHRSCAGCVVLMTLALLDRSMNGMAIAFASCSPVVANGAAPATNPQNVVAAGGARQHPVCCRAAWGLLFGLETLGGGKLAGARPPQTRAGHEGPHLWAFPGHPGKDRVDGGATRLTNAVIVRRGASGSK
jgi:hypothetical protein